jgi:hypothetical protein
VWETGFLRCQECGCTSDAQARGWAALVAEDLGDCDETDGTDPPTIVTLYCPVCAAAEFEYRSEQAAGYI